MGIDGRNASEVFVDEEPYQIELGVVTPLQPRESPSAVEARIARMAERGVLIPRAVVCLPNEIEESQIK